MDEELTRGEKVIQVSYGVTVTVMMLLGVGYLFGDDSPGSDIYGIFWITGAMIVMSAYDFYKDLKVGKKGWLAIDILIMVLAIVLIVRIVNSM
ncbi:hypothetical protein [Alkalibacillus salilacus]|uniref:DUF4181 domain-containing protein n=1 Tax=Alkalibacillus salilacus TaxID=284582 RepID=A0ABT9VG83_9BACI|nr:hypothetical protein [Alkalibacillus salilacus]MDQ0159985.1 hypothetical protein [Alkalibacillus salilacus]